MEPEFFWTNFRTAEGQSGECNPNYAALNSVESLTMFPYSVESSGFMVLVHRCGSDIWTSCVLARSRDLADSSSNRNEAQSSMSGLHFLCDWLSNLRRNSQLRDSRITHAEFEEAQRNHETVSIFLDIPGFDI